MTKEQALAAIQKNIKVSFEVDKLGLLKDLIEPALKEFVDSTENPYDNALYEKLMPFLENLLK